MPSSLNLANALKHRRSQSSVDKRNRVSANPYRLICEGAGRLRVAAGERKTVFNLRFAVGYIHNMVTAFVLASAVYNAGFVWLNENSVGDFYVTLPLRRPIHEQPECDYAFL